MKQVIFIVLFLSCLLVSASLYAEDRIPEQDGLPQIQNLLNDYKNNGYKVLGPLQYLGKTPEKVQLYRNASVPYEELNIIDKKGEQYFLRKNDFVYVLSKNSHVVLIHVDREGGKNA